MLQGSVDRFCKYGRYKYSHLGLEKGFDLRKNFIGREVRERSEMFLYLLLNLVGITSSGKNRISEIDIYNGAKHGFQMVRGANWGTSEN